MEISKLQAYWQLTRMDRPIGSLLLLWPTLWALWIAAAGIPSGALLLTFVLGVLLMRSAGCVINDFADRHVDGHVKRTVKRPLPAGKVSSQEALVLFVLLVLASFLLVLTLNPLTIQLSLVALALAAIYPFMKRVTHLPQLVLGLAFSWAIPMAFAAQSGHISAIAWWLFAANVLWTIAYDTLYAMVDRDDDLQIGVKSTAILFGRFDKRIVGALQLLTLLILTAVGQRLGFHVIYFWALLLVGALFVYQQWLIRQRQREACFQAFLNNNYVGLVVFCGLVLEYQLA